MRLKTRIILMIIVLVIVAAAMTAVTISLTQNAMKTAYTENAITVAEEEIHDLADRLDDRIKDVEEKAGTQLVVDAVARSNTAFTEIEDVDAFIATQDTEWKQTNISPFITERIDNVIADRLSHWAELDSSDPLFSEVMVTNRYGAIVTATSKTSDYMQADESWWQTTWQNGTQMRAVVYDESTDTYGFEISTPITDVTGTQIGMFAVMYPLAEVSQSAARLEAALQNSARVNLVSPHNRLIYGFEEYPDQEFLYDMAKEPWFNELEGDHGAAILQTSHGQELIAYANDSGAVDPTVSGWKVLIRYPVAEVFGPVNNLSSLLLLFGIMLILGTVLAGYHFYRTVQRPIMNLTAVINEISRGNLSGSIDTETLQRQDEIGMLARSFNRLLVSLKLAIKEASG